MNKCPIGILQYVFFFVFRRPEEGFKVVSSFIPFKQRNKLTEYTHTSKQHYKERTNQATSSSRVGPGFFHMGTLIFLVLFSMTSCWSDLRVWPQIPYLSQNTPPNLRPGHWNWHEQQKLLQFLQKFLSSVFEGSGRVFHFPL